MRARARFSHIEMYRIFYVYRYFDTHLCVINSALGYVGYAQTHVNIETHTCREIRISSKDRARAHCNDSISYEFGLLEGIFVFSYSLRIFVTNTNFS